MSSRQVDNSLVVIAGLNLDIEHCSYTSVSGCLSGAQLMKTENLIISEKENHFKIILFFKDTCKHANCASSHLTYCDRFVGNVCGISYSTLFVHTICHC